MRLLSLLLLAACAASDRPVDPGDTDPIGPGCTGGLALQIGRDLGTGPARAGDPIRVGIPPQGGAPYAPFEVRLRGDVPPGARLDAWATAVDRADDVEIGSLSEDGMPSTVGVLCSNVGAHAGWFFAGEIHLRFWGLSLEALRERQVDVTVTVTTPDGEPLTTATSGPLVPL